VYRSNQFDLIVFIFGTNVITLQWTARSTFYEIQPNVMALHGSIVRSCPSLSEDVTGLRENLDGACLYIGRPAGYYGAVPPTFSW
jgi:hypothetical protein